MVLMVVFPARRAPPAGRSAFAQMLEGCASRRTTRARACSFSSARCRISCSCRCGARCCRSTPRTSFAAGPQGLGWLLTGVGVGGTLGGLAANALARAERQALIQAGWIVLMGVAILGSRRARRSPPRSPAA